MLKRRFGFWIILLLFISRGTTANNHNCNLLLENSERYMYLRLDSALWNARLALACFPENKTNEIARSQYNVGINLSLLGRPEEGLHLLKKALQNFRKVENEKGETEALLQIGEVYYNWSEYDKALNYFLKAFQVSKNHGLPRQEVFSLGSIGKYYHSIGIYDRSKKYYDKAFNLAEELQDTLGLVFIHNKLGKHYESLGKYTVALDHYLQSELLLPFIKNEIEIASTYNQLGNVYHHLGELDLARSFHSRALKKRSALHYTEGEAKSLNNLGEVLVDAGLQDSAAIYFTRSLELCERLHYVKGMIKSTQNIAEVKLVNGKWEEARLGFHHAVEMAQKLGYRKGTERGLLFLARLSMEEKEYAQAESFALKGYEISSVDSVSKSNMMFCLLLSRIYEFEKKPQKALEYYKMYNAAYTKILDIESSALISDLENSFDITLKKQENETLKKEFEIQALRLKRRNVLVNATVLISLLMLAMAIIMYGLFRLKQKANAELQVLHEQVLHQQKETEILNGKLNEALRQQVKLFGILGHELRNPLVWFRNLVQMLSTKVDTIDKALLEKSLNALNESATSTYHLMDNLFQWSRGQLGQIKCSPTCFSINEVVIENVVLVQQIADLKSIQVACSDTIGYKVFADRNMVQTVIRNILSNAIKFTPEGGKIQLDLHDSDEGIEISTKDTGKGIAPDLLHCLLAKKSVEVIPNVSQGAGSGLGLALCKEFIEMNGGSISASSEPGKGTTFRFVLPRCN